MTKEYLLESLEKLPTILQQLMLLIKATKENIDDNVDIKTRLEECETNIVALQSTVQSVINTHNQDITTLQGSITDIENRLTTITSNITSINSDIRTIYSKQDAVDFRLDGISTDLSDINSILSSVQQSITDIEDGISRLTERVNNTESAVTNIENDLNHKLTEYVESGSLSTGVFNTGDEFTARVSETDAQNNVTVKGEFWVNDSSISMTSVDEIDIKAPTINIIGNIENNGSPLALKLYKHTVKYEDVNGRAEIIIISNVSTPYLHHDEVELSKYVSFGKCEYYVNSSWIRAIGMFVNVTTPTLAFLYRIGSDSASMLLSVGSFISDTVTQL